MFPLFRQFSGNPPYIDRFDKKDTIGFSFGFSGAGWTREIDYY